MKVRNVEGIIELDNGEKVKFLVTSTGGVHRWGASKGALSECIDMTERMVDGLAESGYLENYDVGV